MSNAVKFVEVNKFYHSSKSQSSDYMAITQYNTLLASHLDTIFSLHHFCKKSEQCQLTIGTYLQQFTSVPILRTVVSEVSQTHQTTATATVSNVCLILSAEIHR